MARQIGLIKIEGTLGDITFVRSKDGYLVKEKTSLKGSRIATEASFQRTRENNAEFGHGAKAAKILRRAFRNQVLFAKDHRMVSRLTKEMIKVVKADATSTRGQRNVLDGELEMLKDFQFNNDAALPVTFQADYTSNIDRVTGLATIDIPPYTATNTIVAPDGSTDFKLIAAAAEIDFEAATHDLATFESGFIKWDNTLQPLTNISLALAPASTKPLFLALGIQFFQEVNGIKYSLKNGAHNALSLIKIAGI